MDRELPEDFDPTTYLIINPDVASQGLDPRDHYLRYGRAEGRVYRLQSNSDEPLPEGFDPQLYLEINPDVATSGQDPVAHYLSNGRAEGRIFCRTTPFRSSIDRPPAPASMNANLNSLPIRPVNPKVIAFYLPQYHRIAENDLWWGEGFTEWTNVKKAKPNLVGHRQPNVPMNQNYYDLSDPEIQKKQVTVAKSFGIDAFCYYMYWFDGRRILEKPIDMRIQDKTIDSDFCICWANENWTRTWDGRENDVLLRQSYDKDFARKFILYAITYLADCRYLRIDGRLLLLVYRVDLIPDCVQTAQVWREEVRRAGLGELHLCAVQSFEITDPRPFGFDAAVEFPPHKWFIDRNLPKEPRQIINRSFRGRVFDYSRAVDFALDRPYPDYLWYRCAFPGWDNTPRRQDNSHFFIEANEFHFERWLTGILEQQIKANASDHQIIFINAWNEWGEGAYLEPDEENGFARLEAVRKSLAKATAQ